MQTTWWRLHRRSLAMSRSHHGGGEFVYTIGQSGAAYPKEFEQPVETTLHYSSAISYFHAAAA